MSTRISSRDLLSTNTSELDSWDLSRSMESTSSEAESQEAIQRGVSRLVVLADRCERLNSNLDHVVSESHKILDNSFLARQEHLTNHVVAQAQSATLEVGLARGVHREYRETVEEMVEAGEELARALERMGDELVKEAEVVFLKVVERKREDEGIDQAVESQIDKFALVFNFEDEGFGEGDGCYY